MKVVVSPGRGAVEAGRRGPAGSTEREVAEAVARRLSAALGRRMISVDIMQPPPGESLESATRLADRIADEPYEVDLLLALQCATSPDPAAWGTRCLYQPGSEDSRLLAECLARRFPNSAWSEVASSDEPLLAAAGCPAAVVEIEHLSNPEVEALMAAGSWQDKVAENLVEGILAFCGPQDIRIVVNGAEIYTDPAPREVYNDVLVPVRVLGAALGAEVTWDPRRRLVSVKTRGQPR